METKKLALLEQISKEIKGGSTTTLVNLINLLSDKQISDNYTQETKNYLESIKIDFELKKGMRIRSKKLLRGKNTNWNSPCRVDIPIGTVFELDSAESNGDLFAILLEGVCITHRRDGDPFEERPAIHHSLKTHVILVEGKNSRHPYDFGVALKSDWEIVTE